MVFELRCGVIYRRNIIDADLNGFQLWLVDSCQQKKAVLGYFHTKFSYVREKTDIHPAHCTVCQYSSNIHSGGGFNFQFRALSHRKKKAAIMIVLEPYSWNGWLPVGGIMMPEVRTQ